MADMYLCDTDVVITERSHDTGKGDVRLQIVETVIHSQYHGLATELILSA